MDQKELNALISLLDDPDEEVYKHIRERLLSLGHEVIPALEDAWEQSFDTLIQNRIENIIQKIQFEKIAIQLKDWAKYRTHDLLAGVLLVARYQYPDLDEEKVRKHIEQIKQDVWLELNNNLTALEKVRVINHIIFDVHNFSGNTTNYHAPQNSYINNVLESKRGNPLSLSILYAIVAQDLDIPIYGVNLPEHFVLAYKDEHNLLPALINEPTNNVLFYINPFSKGSVFSRKEIDAFLKQLKVTPEDSHYEPCSNFVIVKRLIANLMNSYEKLGYPHKVEELRQLLNTLQFEE
jgi:regulator of sirC expression with transglutaminase-like and TPR domain